MKATEVLRRRVVYSPVAFAELVLWHVPKPLPGSRHNYKYRLAYVVRGECVLRYDNEAGKGDHRHIDQAEESYAFVSPEKLVADFQADITRWNDENGHS
jgi:hypothetical protein